jgi:tryptophanyl-tRNA synthetase
MSASVDSSAIFVTDSPAAIKKKINCCAFSGGQATRELQAELGANLDVDVAYQYLSFFLEDDDELERVRARLRCPCFGRVKGGLTCVRRAPRVQIGAAYKAGRMLSGEVKAKLIEVLVVSPWRSSYSRVCM